MEELKNKTLSEAERERGIGRLDYTGAGYGYNLKSHWPKNIKEAKRDAGTPELKWLERMIGAMG